MAGTVVQLSDVHLGRRRADLVQGLDADARLRSVVDAIAALELSIDLVLVTGDISDDGSRPALERVAAAVARLGAPVLAIAGNHDDADAVAEVFGQPGRVDVGGWQVIAIHTSRPGQEHGTVDVDTALAAIDDAPRVPTVLALHHPPMSRSTHPWFRLDGGAELLGALGARPHVKVLVSGHLHDEFSFEGPGGVALLGCPSTFSAIVHHGGDYEVRPADPIGARLLHLGDDSTFTTTVLAVEPTR
jgi:Icc protein